MFCPTGAALSHLMQLAHVFTNALVFGCSAEGKTDVAMHVHVPILMQDATQHG